MWLFLTQYTKNEDIFFTFFTFVGLMWLFGGDGTFSHTIHNKMDQKKQNKICGGFFYFFDFLGLMWLFGVDVTFWGWCNQPCDFLGLMWLFRVDVTKQAPQLLTRHHTAPHGTTYSSIPRVRTLTLLLLLLHKSYLNKLAKIEK